MKTTIDLPEDLVRGIKLRAIHRGLKMRDAAEEIIRRGLEEVSNESQKEGQRVQFPLIECRLVSPESELNPDQIAEELNSQEIPQSDETSGR